MLVLLLVSYAAMRAANWENPLQILPAVGDMVPSLLADKEPLPSQVPGDSQGRLAAATPGHNGPFAQRSLAVAGQGGAADQAVQPPTAEYRHELMAGHTMLLVAGFSMMPMPPELRGLTDAGLAGGTLPRKPQRETARRDRWSLDGWLFLRQGQPGLAVNGAQPASYGSSQAGAVLRYDLAPQNNRRPTAYLRAAQSLQGAGGSSADSEAALGLSARPFAAVPVAAHAEMRIRRSAGSTEIRPAAFAVTEFPPVELPLRGRGEAYLQAGYVGGDFATGFVDGQARITRKLETFRLGELRAGAGAWGGAQKGAARLDIGPSASVDFCIGPANGRAQIDYRVKVAGDAEPGDGVAFTLSTGF